VKKTLLFLRGKVPNGQKLLGDLAMDIKAISGTQPSINMNSQNVEALNRKQISKIQEEHQTENKAKEVQAEKITPEVLKKAIENLNKKLSMLNSQLKIETDNDTGIRVIKVIDKETQKVIRQIPPEAVLKIAKYIDEVAGLIFNEKV